MLLIKVYLEFESAIKAIFIINNNFDYYKYIDSSFYFYKSYYNIIIKKKIPKFKLIN